MSSPPAPVALAAQLALLSLISFGGIPPFSRIFIAWWSSRRAG